MKKHTRKQEDCYYCGNGEVDIGNIHINGVGRVNIAFIIDSEPHVEAVFYDLDEQEKEQYVMPIEYCPFCGKPLN